MKHTVSTIPALLILTLLCSLLCLTLVGCKDGKTPVTEDTRPAESGIGTEADTTPAAPETDAGDETSAPLETTAGTEAETTPETEPETAPPVRLTLSADELTQTDGRVLLTVRVTRVDGYAETAALTAVLSDGKNAPVTVSADAADGDVTLSLPLPEGASGLLSLTVTAAAGDEVLDQLELAMKDGLPQLTPDGIRLVVAAMTDDEKAHLVTGTGSPVRPGASGGTYEIKRLGVPSITVNDGPAGVRYGTAVWYPSICNITSSWDPALAARIGEAVGQDALALGIDVVLGPGMNIQKNVLGGRNFEYGSEDPLLTALMVSPWINGVQSTGTGACLKHYAVNNQETARGSVSSNVTERALREIYLKGFGLAVRLSQPYTVMSAYNGLNGRHTSTDYDLLTGILRDEFGFEGFVMSDWGAAGSMAEKVMAGNDVNMPGNASDAADVLAGLASGKITREALDRCCENVLTAVVRCPAYTGGRHIRMDYKGHDELILETSPDTMVLLKNEGGALPLAAGTKLAVFGNGASATIYGGEGSGSVNAQTVRSIYDAVRCGDNISLYDASGSPFRDAPAHETDSVTDIPVSASLAKAWAEGADAALIVISRSSSEGADHSVRPGDYRLNDVEADMIRSVADAFHAAGKTVTVALNVGGPIEVESWRALADAIVWVGYAGQETGPALVKVLTGEVNPSAKLTMTWPTDYDSTPASQYFPGSAYDTTYYEDIYVGYRYYSTFGVGTSFPFGFGLSYTNFAYSDFSVEKNASGTVTARVTVTNTGKTAGREVVELYVSKPETTQEQPVRELCGFAKTRLLAPGESETVVITVLPEALETYDTAGSRWLIDAGSYTFAVGASSEDIRGEAVAVFDTAVVLADTENRCVPDTDFDYIRKADYTVPTGDEKSANLALGRPAWADYSENDSLTADCAVDGDYVTRWSGLGSSAPVHTWQVDLGEVHEIGRVVIRWESVSVPFTVWVSEDGNDFEKLRVIPVDGSGISEFNLYGQSARVIRVTVPAGGYVSIFEFACYEATDKDRESRPEEDVTPENVALNKPVTSSPQEGHYAPENAVDGDLTTRFGSVPSGEGWLMIDLGRVYTLSGMEIYFEAAWVPYRIQISTDGETFTDLYSGEKDHTFVSLTDLSVDARYLRAVRDGENWFSIIEWSVYGK